MTGETASHHRITSALGEGGMGAVVCRAEGLRLKRNVALKFLARDLVGVPQARARFIQGAEAASVPDHPNVCTICDIDEADGLTEALINDLDRISAPTVIPRTSALR